MFYLPQAGAIWIAAIWAINWRRFPKLLTYGLAGALIAYVENELGRILNLWEYHDSGPLADHHGVAMVPELIALRTGHMVHHRWWCTPASVLAYLPTWIGLWALHRYLEKPLQN